MLWWKRESAQKSQLWSAPGSREHFHTSSTFWGESRSFFMTKIENIKPQEAVELGKWALRQKQLYAIGRLSAYRIKKLEALKGWSWALSEADKQVKLTLAEKIKFGR